jgi:hypothetical protein
MKYVYSEFKVRTGISSGDTLTHWYAFPLNQSAHIKEGIPCLAAGSEEELVKMMDFVLSVPVENRPVGSDTAEWNRLMKSSGVIGEKNAG